MMKLWLTPWTLSPNSNLNWSILSYTLYIRHNNSFFLRNSHLPRRKLWLTNPIYACQWRLPILYLPIPPCRPRSLLWFLYLL
uniref:Uncharacterized protein n=1 Tax=Sciurus vulgaris TaxID=55149 RepID=A0A8D2CY82_SCIVU